jgi:hypothetical protein
MSVLAAWLLSSAPQPFPLVTSSVSGSVVCCGVQDLLAKLEASRQEIEGLEAQLQGAAAQHNRQLQEREEKVGAPACGKVVMAIEGALLVVSCTGCTILVAS